MDLIIVLGILIIVGIVILGKIILATMKNMNAQAKNQHEIMYYETRRASRLSLQCRLELENLTMNNKKHYNDVYDKQTEILALLELIVKDMEDINTPSLGDEESKASDMVQKVKIRQGYISDVLEKLEKHNLTYRS